MRARATMAVALAVLGAGLAGCGSGDEPDARAVAQRFYSAIAAQRGEAACRELSDATVQQLEKNEKKACAKAVTELDLPRSRPGAARVYLDSAVVSQPDGMATFLEDTRSGWKVSAAGCKPRAEQPYDCELED